jgi:hypothetical protein
MTDTTKNPSRRRTALRIVAEHVGELLSRLKGLCGLPICGLATSTAGTVRLMVPGWAITVTDVAPGPQAALTAAVEQPHCYLADVGRYGRFWWVAVDYLLMVDLHRTVILGSRLVLTRIEDDHLQLEEPSVSALLTTF